MGDPRRSRSKVRLGKSRSPMFVHYLVQDNTDKAKPESRLKLSSPAEPRVFE